MIGKTDDTQGQTYPLIQIEGLWGQGRERKKKQKVNDPQVPSPILVHVPCSLEAKPYLYTGFHSIGQHLLQGSNRQRLLQDEAAYGQIRGYILRWGG